MIEISENLTLVLLGIATTMFVWLAAKSKNWRSFHFQVSVFVIIWIAGEAVEIIQENILAELGEDTGMIIHLGSMVYLSVMLWLRYYTSKKGGKKMIDRAEDYDN